MRKIIVYKPVRNDSTKKWETVEDGTAFFHAFGCSYEEFNSGPGNYSVAIIERDDGTVEMVAPDRIKFIKE